MNQPTSLDDLLTVSAFVKKYPELVSKPALRFQLYAGDHNGLNKSGAVIRLGRRVLIDETRYCAWVCAHRVSAV